MEKNTRRSRFVKLEVENIRNKKMLADIPRGAERVWVGLGLYVDEAGKSFPTIETLAVQTGLSIRAVMEQIKKLDKAGMIQVRKEKVKGVCFHNVYFLKPGFYSYGMKPEEWARVERLRANREKVPAGITTASLVPQYTDNENAQTVFYNADLVEKGATIDGYKLEDDGYVYHRAVDGTWRKVKGRADRECVGVTIERNALKTLNTQTGRME